MNKFVKLSGLKKGNMRKIYKKNYLNRFCFYVNKKKF